MILDLLQKLDMKAWSVFGPQSAILTSDAMLYSGGNENGYIILSAALVLSPFSLQIVRCRFLMFFPLQTYLNQPSQRIDTKILWCFFILSISLLSLGASNLNHPISQRTETISDVIQIWIIPILPLILSLMWHFVFDRLDRSSFVKEMKKYLMEKTGECPKRNGKYAHFLCKVQS